MNRYFNDLMRQVSQETSFPLQQQSALIDLHSIQSQADFKIIDEYVLSIEKIPHLDLNETELFLTELNNTEDCFPESYEEFVDEIEPIVDKSLFWQGNSTFFESQESNEMFIPENLENSPNKIDMLEPIVDRSLFEIVSDSSVKKCDIHKKTLRLIKTIKTKEKSKLEKSAKLNKNKVYMQIEQNE